MANNINDQFISSYSRDFAEKIIANLPESDSAVDGKGILNLTPSRQVNFFVLKLLYGQWQDEMKKLESPYFNFKNDEVKKALTTYMNVLSQHIEVSHEDLKPLLENGVKDTLSWIFFPGETLRAEVEEKGYKQLSAMKSISKYFKVYQDDLSYLIAERSEMGITEFLDEWDQLMDQKSKDAIIEKELGDLSEVLEISLSGLVETEEESVEEETEEEMVLEVKEDVEENFFDSVEDKSEEEDYPEDELEDSYDDAQPEEEVEEETSVLDENEEPEDHDQDDEPTGNGYAHSEASEEERVELDDSLNQKYARTEETLNDQFKEDQENDEQVSVAARHQQKKISSVLEAVSVNQEYMFTTELFGGEKSIFLDAVEKIESCDSFDESVEMLVSNYSKDYSWDMNSVEVKELLKVVFRRFR